MLSAFDKAILNIVQGGLPLVHRPYEIIANQLGVTEAVVIASLKKLKNEGYIRKVGAFFDSVQLGYHGTLVALKVDPNFIDSVAEVVNSFHGVTHNYEREGVFNIWFTLIAANMDEKNKILSQIKAAPGVLEMMDLPAQKKYKVNVNFPL